MARELVPLKILIDPETKRRLQQHADDNIRPVASIARDALREYVSSPAHFSRRRPIAEIQQPEGSEA